MQMIENFCSSHFRISPIIISWCLMLSSACTLTGNHSNQQIALDQKDYLKIESLAPKIDHNLKKKPSTSEVLDWLKLILAEDLKPEDLRRDGVNALPRLHGALLKNEQDVHLFERIAFIANSNK